MTSEGPESRAEATEAYVWVWLPEASSPVVAGRIERMGRVTAFNYGRSYLNDPHRIPLYLPELPLVPGRQLPGDGLQIAGCIDDAAPDAWGQRVIARRRFGAARDGLDLSDLSTITYLLESDSDRVGALDFQVSADRYEPRSHSATLEELLEAADRIDQGAALPAPLADAILGGSSLGGARPKAGITVGDRHLIAKFPSVVDTYPVVGAEAVAMDLAARCGLRVAPVSVEVCAGRPVLLVDRFDRPGGGRRRAVVSALTLLGLHELAGHHATYWQLAELISERFQEPAAARRELFARIAFNVCVGNTDDHARNHAAFWDGERLSLTPAYDLCPQPRTGNEAAQAMAYAPRERRANLGAVIAAADRYGLRPSEAEELVDHLVSTIERDWDDACDRALLTIADRDRLWHRAVLNPSIRYPT